MSRILLPTVLALPLLGLTLPAAEDTQRYRIEMVQSQQVDLSAFGQGEQNTAFTLEGFVTVTLTDSADGKVYHVVLDSSRIASQEGQAGMPDMAGTAGAAYHGFVTAEGKIENFAVMGDSAAPSAGVFAQVLEDLYPTIRGGLTAGTNWVDTTSNTNELPNGGTLSTEAVTTYTVAGPETWQGVPSIRIDAKTANTLAMVQQGANMDGTGEGTGAFYVTPEGGLVGVTQNTTADLLFVTPNGDVPLVQSVMLTVTPVR